MMPNKMSSVETAKRVAKIKPKLKMIIIISLLHWGVATKLYKYGVVHVIIKPLDKDKTLQAITNALHTKEINFQNIKPITQRTSLRLLFALFC
jgi:DNA-binding NtrC family response regulator